MKPAPATIVFGICIAVLTALQLMLLPHGYAQSSRSVDTQSSTLPEDRTIKIKDRVALVIGNANYKYITPLDNPINDANDMCNTLRSLGFDTICHFDAKTRREMKDAMLAYTRHLKKGGVGLFYFAGHALQDNSENYLMPTQAQLRNQADIQDEGVSMSHLMALLSDVKGVFNIVILDACRNNPLAKLQSSPGLARITTAPTGTIVSYATAPGQEAADGMGGRNGVFTEHLLKHIVTPGLTIEDTLKLVNAAVVEQTKGQQQPWYDSSFSGQFCFAGCDDLRSLQELARIKQEKEALELRAARLENDSSEKKKQLDILEARARQAEEALEKRVRELQAVDERSGLPSGQNKTDPELTKAQQELEILRRANQDLLVKSAQLQREREELHALRIRVIELEKRAAEINTLQSKLADLEKQSARKDEELNRLQQDRLNQRPPAEIRRRVIPPMF